jgi:hypothetical protein
MVTIKRAKSRGTYGPDPAIEAPQGAHLLVRNQKLFEPKFHDETGAFWSPSLALGLIVKDDFSEDGEHDNDFFTDYFALKLDPDLADEMGLEENIVKSMEESDFSAEERKALLDMESWTIRPDTKLDSLLTTLYGKKWAEGKMEFKPEDLVNAEFIARLTSRTGKRPGTYTIWDSYVSASRPEKKKKNSANSQNSSTKKDGAKSKSAKAAAVGLSEEDLNDLPF